MKTLLRDKSLYVIFIAVVIGLFFRLKGLGKWPLALDEYYIVKSAENILKFGLPEWTAGGYYTRGLLHQYLIAGLLLVGVKTEFAARIIPVLLNLLAFPALFILAKKLSGKLLGAVILVVFIFSVWEIEFSRFARMYVPFQTLFIWYIFFFYKYFVENDEKSVKWIFILSFLSILVYEGSIFPALLNFLILLRNKETKRFDINRLIKIKFNLVHAGIVLLIFLFSYYFNTFDARGLSLPDLYPENYRGMHNSIFEGSRFYMPSILLTTLPQNTIWIIPFVFFLGISVYAFYKVIKASKIEWPGKIIISLLIILAVLNLFGIIIFLVPIFLLIDWLRIEDFKRQESRFVIVSLITIAIFWFAYSLLTSSWYPFFSDFNQLSKTALLKKILLLFFNYPHNYFEFYRYVVTIPVLTLVFISSVFIVVYKAVKVPYQESLPTRFILFILLLMILTVSFIRTPLGETRYTFFLYPLVLLTVFSAIKIISEAVFKTGIKKRIAFVILGFTIFVFSGDFNLKHILKIDSEEANFRIGYNHDITRHYYSRWDVKTPAEVVNNEINENDITITDELNIEYYLNKLDYIYINYDHSRFIILSTNYGRTERWTNANLVYTNEQLLDLIKNCNGNVWFITIYKPHLEEIEFKKNFADYLYYTGIDKTIFVYKIPGGTTLGY